METRRHYVIRWVDYEPRVVTGTEYEVGKTKKQTRVKLTTGEIVQVKETYRTIKSAIEGEIGECAVAFGPNVFHRRDPKPWSLVSAVIKLWRLYRKLKTHNLV